MFASGHSYKEIARLLGLTPATVRTYLRNAYLRLGGKDKVQLENMLSDGSSRIGVFHPKWDERPLLLVVKKPGVDIDKQELLVFYEGRIAKWWTPDDVVFIDSLPLGATGKIQKNKLRDQFKVYRLPTA